jgi:hypothetical protein
MNQIPCTSGFQLTVTAYEDGAPQSTMANDVVLTCP